MKWGELMSENQLVAKVSGKEITRQDVLKFLNDMGPQMAMQFQSPDGIRRVIDEMVNQELLYFDAIENKLDQDEEFIEVLEATKTALLKNYAFSKVIANEVVSEDEIRDYFNENKDMFKKEETVKASHILVDSEEKANEILDKLNEGLSFEDAAKEYSTCPSKEDGGNLGEFGKGQMVKEFEDEAFNMEVGTVSKPVKTQFGYHLIKLMEKNPPADASLDEVKEEINRQLLISKQQDKYLGKIQDLKSKYEVEMF